MAKTKTHFLCRECGGVQSRWLGKCPDCGAWDALERYVEPVASAHETHAAGAAERSGTSVTHAVPLVEVKTSGVERIPTGIGEMDRVLGGGIVPGSVVLLGGEPGIGKSTLLLQAAARLALDGRTVLYVSSEESAYQTRLRAERLFGEAGDSASGSAPGSSGGSLPAALDQLYILAETNLAIIVEQTRRVRPAVLVLDSIQMVFEPSHEGAPGSIAQLRRCCAELVRLAKVSGMAVAVVGHVTKEGQLAGPKLIEHLVDAVLSFEGDRNHALRVVRGIKNRFGTTLEVGLFEMTATGLAEVADDGAGRDPAVASPPGSVVCPVMHGTRCRLAEIQALTAPGFPGNAKRRTSGLDGSRLAMLIAVLEQHGGLRLADQDVFVSAAGGVKIVEPAADLAVCMAIASAHYRTQMAPGTAVVGEVGLGGEVRPVPGAEQRVRAAVRLGYGRVVTRPGREGRTGPEIVEVASITAALALFEKKSGAAQDRPRASREQPVSIEPWKDRCS